MEDKSSHTKACVMNRILDHAPNGITHKQLYKELENYNFSRWDIDCALDELVIFKKAMISDDRVTRIISLEE